MTLKSGSEITQDNHENGTVR